MSRVGWSSYPAMPSEFRGRDPQPRSAHGLADLPPQLLARIEPEPMSGCWLWSRKHLDNQGYARLHNRLAHRIVYRAIAGAIRSQALDHTCRVRSCVNPAHLRQVTHRENILAPGALGPTKQNADKAACPRCGGAFREIVWRRGRRCYPCAAEYGRLRHALLVRYGVRRLSELPDEVRAEFAALLSSLSQRQPVRPETPGDHPRAALAAALRPPAEPGTEPKQQRRELRSHTPVLVVQREHEA